MIITAMNTTQKLYQLAGAIFLFLAATSGVQAHLMVAQHGTLNWKGDDLFVVLSLPVSAFDDVDDDMDGNLSVEEFNRHRLTLAATVSNGVTLKHESTVIQIEGLLLSPVTKHHDGEESADQLVVMGKFSMEGISKKTKLHIDLYGEEKQEQSFKVALSETATQDKKTLYLTVENPSVALLDQ
jgi:hypothetical protein